MTRSIKATKIGFSHTSNGVRYYCDVSGVAGLSHLIYEVRSSTGHPYPATSAAWVSLALLLPAMITGKDLEIEGKLPALFLHLLRSDIQSILRNFNSGLTRIKIDAELEGDRPQAPAPLRIGTGFSAGVDSFAALKWFEATKTHKILKVTDLLTFDVGAFNIVNEAQSPSTDILFQGAAERASAFAVSTGRHCHSVKSNIVNAYTVGEKYDFIRTHTLRNASAAALFENEIDLYLYASGYSYNELDLKGSNSMANIDPILLPLISLGRLRMISANAGEGRVEKTARISHDPAVRSMLDVCVQRASRRAKSTGAAKNCSRCVKCCRTMATLDAMGELDNFDQVFNLRYYRKHREEILSDIKRRAKASPIDRSIVGLFRSSL